MQSDELDMDLGKQKSSRVNNHQEKGLKVGFFSEGLDSFLGLLSTFCVSDSCLLLDIQ